MKNNQSTILGTINGDTHDADAMHTVLTVMRDDFDRPDFEPVYEPIREWYMPNSELTVVLPQTEQFQQLLTRLNLEIGKVKDIKKIENIMWSVQYSIAKTNVDHSQGSTANEVELFYGCPSNIAHDILQHGFNLAFHCIHGNFLKIFC